MLKKQGLWVFLILVVAFLIFYWGVWVKWQAVLVSWGNVRELKREIQLTQEIIQETPQAQALYQEARNKAEKIIQALPARKDLPSLIAQAESLAARSNLTLESVNIAEAQAQKDDVTEVNVDLSLIGSYENFKKYLAWAEKNLPFWDIKEIEFITSPPEQEGLTTSQFKLTLKTYFITP